VHPAPGFHPHERAFADFVVIEIAAVAVRRPGSGGEIASGRDVQLNLSLLQIIPGAVGTIAFGKYLSPDYEAHPAEFTPPVGWGQVFHDLNESEQLPIIELTRSYRQSAESDIAGAPKQIKTGIVPGLPFHAEMKSDCYFIEAGNAVQIQQLVVNAATSSLPGRCGADPYREIQILTPMRNEPLGTNALNGLFRSAEPTIQTVRDFW
jgi:hypothetical protein